MLSDHLNTYAWNAESQIKTAGGVNYTYDGDGDRVQKSNGKIYWYGAGSEILDESDASGNITDEYIFFGGKRIARRDSSGNVVYYVADHLGTSRVVANSTGGILDQSDFYPFGGEHVFTSSSGNTYKFESKERDAETNNDDFGARYYSSVYGRFLTADWSAIPVPVPYANLTNPQTLNLYAMVSDNPETFADLDGHMAYFGEYWQNSSEPKPTPDPPPTTTEQTPAQVAQNSAHPPKDPGKKGECQDGWCWDEKSNEWRRQKPSAAAAGAAALAELACVFAEPCGGVQAFVTGVALIATGSVLLYRNLIFSKGREQDLIEAIADEYGIDPKKLGDAIEDRKSGLDKGSPDLTKEQIRKIAKAISRGDYWSPK